MESMDNPANFAIEPSFSEHSEEFKNRFSMNSSVSKPDSSEQSIMGKLDSLILMQSKFQNNIYDSLSQTLQDLLNEKFDSYIKEKLDMVLVQTEFKSQKLSKSKVMKFGEEQDLNEFEEKFIRRNSFHDKFEEFIKKNRNFEELLRENEKLRNEKQMLENMNESICKVKQDLKESLIREKEQKEKFIHLFFDSKKHLKKLAEILKIKEDENLEISTKLEQKNKEIQDLNEEKLESLAKNEENDKKILKLNQEIKNLQNLANSQKGKILKLKQVKREEDRRNFKKILVNNSNDVLEAKNKLEDLHKKLLYKINEFTSLNLDETAEKFTGIQGNQFEYLDYLKNYSYIIEKQIFDLEAMEKEFEDSENTDELLVKLQEKNQSFNEDKTSIFDILTYSSEDELR